MRIVGPEGFNFQLRGFVELLCCEVIVEPSFDFGRRGDGPGGTLFKVILSAGDGGQADDEHREEEKNASHNGSLGYWFLPRTMSRVMRKISSLRSLGFLTAPAGSGA